jgi:hypothetical protein
MLIDMPDAHLPRFDHIYKLDPAKAGVTYPLGSRLSKTLQQYETFIHNYTAQSFQPRPFSNMDHIRYSKVGPRFEIFNSNMDPSPSSPTSASSSGPNQAKFSSVCITLKA